MTHVLRIDASARHAGSVSRELNDTILNRLNADTVTIRDLSQPLPQIDEAWIAANFTPEGDRTDTQRATLSLSDNLVSEIEAADILVIGMPIYNFGVPAALKAWIDLVARAGRTFHYTADGPVGLLKGKRAIVAVTSGGTEAGSNIDFATGHMAQVLQFIGITDVTFVNADRLAKEPVSTVQKAKAQIAALAA